MAAPAKLPLTVRKNIRDKYESVKPDLEAKLSSLLGVPWTIDIDVPQIYETALQPEITHDYPRESTGAMLTNYVESATDRISDFVKKFGSDGVTELNTVAHAHALTLAPQPGKVEDHVNCDIVDGRLRIVCETSYLGVNIYQSLEHLDAAINTAGIQAATAQGTPRLSFVARMSVRDAFAPATPAVAAKLEALLHIPGGPTLTADFPAIAAALTAHAATHGAGTVPRDWERSLGAAALAYFEGLAYQLDQQRFGKDDLLQEGFREAVEKNEVVLRVVEKLERRTYNEAVVRDGVLYLQTTPGYWYTNTDQVAEGLVDLL